MEIRVQKNGIRILERSTPDKANYFDALLSAQQMKLLLAMQREAKTINGYRVFGSHGKTLYGARSVLNSMTRLERRGLAKRTGRGKIVITREGDHLVSLIFNEIASYPPQARPAWWNSLLN